MYGSRFDDASIEMVPAHMHPGFLTLPIFPPPGVLASRSPDEFFPSAMIGGWGIYGDEKEMRADLRQLGYKNTAVQLDIRFEPFVRMIAKIAHAGAVGKYGIDGFVHRLPNVILEDKEIAHWVGNAVPAFCPTIDATYSIESALGKKRGTWWVYAFISMFRYLGGERGMPNYWVVVGEAKEPAMDAVRRARANVQSRPPLHKAGKTPSGAR